MQVAENLLKIGAVKLNVTTPFIWTSGIKSPIYCDNRSINSEVEIRESIVNEFVERIRKEFPQTEIIAAVAIGGIPFGILIADRLKLPFIYVRDKPKNYGLMRQIEGSYKPGNKVVLIEDHISTGQSSMKAIQGLRDGNLDLLCLFSITTYGFKKAEELFKKENINYTSLCTLDSILNTAVGKKIISEQEKLDILEFRNSPDDWFDRKKAS